MTVPKDTNNSNGNTKAFGGVLAIIAIIAGIYAMVEPMNQRIDFLERQLNSAAEKMTRDDERERIDMATISVMSERFAEVETQFDDMERRILDCEHWLIWWQRTVPYLNATQNEKIYRLEEEIFGDTECIKIPDGPQYEGKI